jgi:serine/threonine protein phosphatase 1
MHETRTGSPALIEAAYPPAPQGLVIYLVGDIHGRLDLLLGAQERIDRDKRKLATEEVTEVYLGDYIDRGPHSAAVISSLIERSNTVRAKFLRGNHEQLLLDFIHGSDCLEQWKAVGGTATLVSYGIEPDQLAYGVPPVVVRDAFKEKVPEEHREFYRQTGSYIGIGPYLAVHAGLRPGVRLEEQTPRDLLNIRGDFLNHTGDFGHIVIHGHTPVREPDLRKNRINIDTGAFATNRLTCIRIGKDGVSIVDDDGR